MSECNFVEKREVNAENKKEVYYDFSLTLSEEEYELFTKVVPDKQTDIIDTAIEEFVDFLKSPKRFSKFSSFQEYRLFLLIKNVFKEKFVSDANVRKIFKLDSGPAKKMISNVKIDYEEEIESYNRLSMKTFIEENDEDGKYSFICKSQTMIDSLNKLLLEKKSDSRRILKAKETLGKYQIYIDEYKILKEALQ